jgi:hypothetical protein
MCSLTNMLQANLDIKQDLCTHWSLEGPVASVRVPAEVWMLRKRRVESPRSEKSHPGIATAGRVGVCAL